jgi:gas vesicle protein
MSIPSPPSPLRRTLWSALAGGAVGFTIGWLTAPHQGGPMRRRVAYRLDRLARRLARFLRELAAASVESEARRNRDALVADARARADHIRDDIEALLDELRRQEAAAPASPADAPTSDAPTSDAPTSDS